MPPLLHIICALIGTIPIGFGINAFLRPDNALSFFNNATMPLVHADIIRALLMIYAARDIFMGVAIYATAFYGSRKALGFVMITGGFNAFIDGLAMQLHMGGGGMYTQTRTPDSRAMLMMNRVGSLGLCACPRAARLEAGILLELASSIDPSLVQQVACTCSTIERDSAQKSLDFDIRSASCSRYL